MLFKSPVYSQASGSVAGLVYSRNAGGQYVRARVLPTNPSSPAQVFVRDAMRTLVNNWTSVLTDIQREGWNTYAFNTPTLNRVGDATHKSGQQMYIRSNIARIQSGVGAVANAPTVFNLGEFTPINTVTADGSADTISIAFNTADPWANADGGALLIYMGRPQNATRNFGKGPYQLLTAILGDSMLAPTSPVVPSSLFPLTTGQKVFLRITCCQADGRYSDAQLLQTIVVP